MKQSIVISLVLLFSVHTFYLHAQEPQFIVQKEDVEVTIHNDATVEIWYYLSIKTTKGPQRGIYLGIPTNVYDYAAYEPEKKMLKVEKETNQLKIWFSRTAQAGDVTTLKVSFFVKGMIYPDEEGRLGMEFYPAWWDRQRTERLRVKFILPHGCDISEVGNYPVTAENRGMEGGKAFLYFERANVDPGDTFRCGVSFPEKYVNISVKERVIPSVTISPLVLVFLFVVIGAIIFWKKIRKSKYTPPKLQMESLGPRKDLDPVEAAYILDAHPLKLVNLIVLGLVRKGAIRIVDWGPVKVDVKEQEKEEDFNCPNCGAPLDSTVPLQTCGYCGSKIRISGVLTYYETEFLLNCIRKDGTLDQDAVFEVLDMLYKKVDKKMVTYFRRQTAAYYRKMIDNYWADIETATPQDKYRLFGEQVHWLMIDLDFDKKVQEAFEGVDIPYTPSSWWLWYNAERALNGKEFSENISQAKYEVEYKSGIKRKPLKESWEKHGAPKRPSLDVIFDHKDCVCACVSCACACACVSCACACASGGGF